MAARSWLEDIDDNFFKCPICKQLFDGPKCLPCLHRYCRLCLKLLIGGHKGSLHCPECDEEFAIPPDGVDEVKDDVFLEEIIRYIKLLQSLKNDQSRVCGSCFKFLKVTAYCFKCDGFLCKVCKESHFSNISLKEHIPYSLHMDCNDSKRVSVEKLFSALGPRPCSFHSQKQLNMCCETCVNILVCMDCGLGKHNGHTMRDIKYVAEMRTKYLKEELHNLTQNKDYIYKIPKRIEITKEEIKSNMDNLSKKLLSNYEKEARKRKERIEEINGQNRLAIAAAADIDNLDFPELTKQMEEDIQQIREKYENLRGEKRKEMKNKILYEFKQKYGSELNKLNEELGVLENDYKAVLKSLETQKCENSEKIVEISKHAQNGIKQLENVEVVITSILSSGSKWAVVHWASDLITAMKPLIEKTRKEFPRLESLSHITDKCTRLVNFYDETKSLSICQTGYPITFKHKSFSCKSIAITSFDVTDVGNVIVLGFLPKNVPYGAKYNGSIVCLEISNTSTENSNTIFSLEEKITLPTGHHCHGPAGGIVSSDSFVTLSQQYQIVTYDIRKVSNVTEKQLPLGEYQGNISGFIAADNEKKKFYFLDKYGKRVFVFDRALSHICTLILPIQLSSPTDMILRGNNLMICGSSVGNYQTKRAYSFSLRGSELRFMFDFVRPKGNFDSAFSISSDENGYLYVLWGRYIQEYSSFNRGQAKPSSCIARYSQCGHHLLSSTEIDSLGTRLRITKTHILILTLNKKIHSYHYHYY